MKAHKMRVTIFRGSKQDPVTAEIPKDVILCDHVVVTSGQEMTVYFTDSNDDGFVVELARGDWYGVRAHN